MDKRKLILNAFRPNAEIENPEAFAGRIEQVLELTDSLKTDGTVPLIYGGRGLGKTSLAVQMARIALGDDALLKVIGKEDRLISGDDHLVPFWVSCSDETRTKDQVIQRIINSAEGFIDINSFENNQPTSTTISTKLDLKVFQAQAINNYEKDNKRKFSKLGIEDQFYAVIDSLNASGYTNILIIIDELDRVDNTKGLANFIKNASNTNLKFMLVGIANTISTLLDDHVSLQRSLHPVKISTMTFAESKDIVKKVITILKIFNIDSSFSAKAYRILLNAAGGYPWFVHVLAQEALKTSWDRGHAEVVADDMSFAIKRLSSNRFAQQYSDRYQAAVRDSRQREIVLRLMAKWGADDVPLSEIYPIAKKLQVMNPYTSKKDLMLKRHGEVLINPPMHTKGIIRFKDSMFKRYIDLRSPIYNGVKDEVDDAWKKKYNNS